MSKPRTKPRRRQRTAKPLDLPTSNLLARAMEAVEQEDAVVDFLTTPGPCAVCGSETWLLATRVAEPPEAQQLGAAPGRTRIVTSHLCQQCGESGGVARLEAAMWEDLGEREP